MFNWSEVVVYYGTPALQPQYRLMMFVQKLQARLLREKAADSP
jgi:hypothetical protein